MIFSTYEPKENLIYIAMNIPGPWKDLGLKWKCMDDDGGILVTKTVPIYDGAGGRKAELAYNMARKLRELMRDITGIRQYPGLFKFEPGDTIIFHGGIAETKLENGGVRFSARVSRMPASAA